MIDSSGMRFYYTKQLRKYEAGMLFIGAAVTTSLMIPPNQVDWETTGFCSADCTREVCVNTFPKRGVTPKYKLYGHQCAAVKGMVFNQFSLG